MAFITRVLVVLLALVVSLCSGTGRVDGLVLRGQRGGGV